MDIYALRRNKIISQLPVSSVVILHSGSSCKRNKDVFYPFRSNSNFMYCTDFPEPNSVLMLYKNSSGESTEVLFNKPLEIQPIYWETPCIGLDGAVSQYGVDKSLNIDEISNEMKKFLSDCNFIYYPLDNVFLNKFVSIWSNDHKREIMDINPILAEMRLIKSDEELVLIKKAMDCSQEAHLKVMQKAQPGLFEYELEAIIVEQFYSQGCRHSAYPSIVGSGANACILHYTNNDRRIQDGDLILVDAGAEYIGYAADITRTFPANGVFSKEQRDLYNIVLSSQIAAISHLKPGVTWTEIDHIASEVMVDGLLKCKILQGTVEENIKSKVYKKYFPHGLGHWLGLDVHDAGDYKINNKARKFVPGMLLTIEPGLYMVPNSDLEHKWHNIGIRIEDDILITEHGCEVLTARIPKDPDAIEEFMQTRE